MPQATDPTTVPPAPLVTIVLSSNGTATVDNTPVPPPLPGQDIRTAALIEVTVRAARMGRAVRAVAKEPNGSVWPLIVDVDGTVTPVPAHPALPAAPAPEPSTWSAPPPVPADPHPTVRGPVLQECPPMPVTPAQPGAVPGESREADRPETTVEMVTRVVRSGKDAAPAPAVTSSAVPPQADLWSSPLPSDYADLLEQVRAVRASGDLAAAAAAAEDLESALEDEFSPNHPHTVNASQLRALFAMESKDWATSAELHADVARRRHQLGAPLKETRRAVINTYQSWKRIPDPGTAAALGPKVLQVLLNLGSPDLPSAERRLKELSARAA